MILLYKYGITFNNDNSWKSLGWTIERNSLETCSTIGQFDTGSDSKYHSFHVIMFWFENDVWRITFVVESHSPMINHTKLKSNSSGSLHSMSNNVSLGWFSITSEFSCENILGFFTNILKHNKSSVVKFSNWNIMNYSVLMPKLHIIINIDTLSINKTQPISQSIRFEKCYK